MKTASIWRCVGCSFETFKYNARNKHARGSDECPFPNMVKETVAYSLPSLEQLSNESHPMFQHQIIVDSKGFARILRDRCDEETYVRLLSTSDPLERAKIMFDLTLSKGSGNPNFWNWIRANERTVLVLDRDRNSSRTVRVYAVDEFAEQMTFAAFKLFESVFRVDNDDVMFWKVLDHTMTPSGPYRNVRGYEDWMVGLRDYIVARLPQRSDLPGERLNDDGPVILGDDGPGTLLAWTCLGCSFSTTTKTSAKTHAETCRGGYRGHTPTIVGVHTKFRTVSEMLNGTAPDPQAQRMSILERFLRSSHVVFEENVMYSTRDFNSSLLYWCDENHILMNDTPGTDALAHLLPKFGCRSGPAVVTRPDGSKELVDIVVGVRMRMDEPWPVASFEFLPDT